MNKIIYLPKHYPNNLSKTGNLFAGQESWTGTPESSNVRAREILKLPAREHGTGLGRDGRRGILKCRPPTESK